MRKSGKLTLASFDGDVKRMPQQLDTMVGEKGYRLVVDKTTAYRLRVPLTKP